GLPGVDATGPVAGRRTALATGATWGLGAAFPRRLAAERVNLVLVARDGQRLQACAADLSTRYGITAETLAADLSADTGCAAVEARLTEAAPATGPIHLLVNNARPGVAGGFADTGPAALDTLTALNVVAVERLTHAALRSMLPRRRGGVLNVSSVSGFAPGARGATYSASKAWVTAFSRALHLQLATSG